MISLGFSALAFYGAYLMRSNPPFALLNLGFGVLNLMSYLGRI